MMIYGAGSASTSSSDILRVLGFLQIETTPIHDTDKASDKGMQRKRDNGWEDRWTFALPVRRAWRVTQKTRLDQIAFRTYQPEKGRAIAAWSAALEPDELEKALALRVTEVPVFGEPPLQSEFVDRPLGEAFRSQSLSGSEGIDFAPIFARLQDLLERFSGERFKRFDEGLIAAWESYKPRLRDHALIQLDSDSWSEGDIGSGKIVEQTIDAIEIQASHGDLTNNLVFWQNRFGHANRDHRALIEAKSSGAGLEQLENLIFELFRDDADEPKLFEALKESTGGKYPLLAYLFFLKDMDRFMPIQPTGFDRAFEAIGLELRTRGQCSWENYNAFNQALSEIRHAIEAETGLENVKLIDAHSLVWLFSTLIRKEDAGELDIGKGANDRVLGARERSIADIKYSVGKTVFNSNGQTVERKVKDKELRMTGYELDNLLRHLLEVQEERCAITGQPFQYQGAHSNSNMLPSLDRIDSDGHYEKGNLQLVCRFINFWKQAADDLEFRRLINVVRGFD
ncbi:MAG: hypothetical protein KUG69_15245 [Marinosulfonomonas sp.]|nr:hypothetical protein [Marinosulfonomonas sp.]